MIGTVVTEYAQFCDPLDKTRSEAIYEILLVTLEMAYTATLQQYE